jgi:hypothetical protein
LFVKRVVEEENSNTPLGILRPGILPIMEKLHSLKKRGKLTSIIIYSNNKCLPCLEFVSIEGSNPDIIIPAVLREYTTIDEDFFLVEFPDNMKQHCKGITSI